MAFTHVAAATAAEVASGDLTLTEPAGVQAGDLLIACIAYRGSAAFSLPAGWSLVRQESSGDTVSPTGGIGSGLMAWINRGGSAPALTFTRTAGDVALGNIDAWRPADATKPATLTASVATTLGAASTTVATGSGFSTLIANELLVIAGWQGDNVAASAYSDSSGATWAERQDSNTTTGADTGLAIATATKATAGAITNFQYTASGTAARHVIIAAAFRETKVLTADTVAYTLTGTTTRLLYGRKLVADTVAYALTGIAVAFARTRVLKATTAAYALTGTTTALKAARKLVAATASYALTGFGARIQVDPTPPFSGAVAAQVAADTLTASHLVQFDFASGTMRVWLGLGDLSAGGYTWQGIGALGAVGDVDTSPGLSVDPVSLTLSGIDTTILARALDHLDEVYGRRCTVYLQAFDSDEQTVGNPVTVFAGLMDKMPIKVSAEAATITLSVEHILLDKARPPHGYYTHQDQLARFPGDLGCWRTSTYRDHTVDFP